MAGMGVANIGSWGRRRRTIMGIASLAVGVALVGAVAASSLSPGWALLAFAPFAAAMMGFMQAQQST